MNGLPIEVSVGVLLLSIAPDFAILAIRVRLSRIVSKDPVVIRVLVLSFLCLLDIVVFGPPHKFFDSALLTVSLLSLAICAGVIYYFVERWRLGIARRRALRITKRVFLTEAKNLRILGILLWTAIIEEVLFRWYILTVPLAYGLLPLFACILVSCGAFALAHQNFGNDIMISRGLFGVVLMLPVLFWGDLLFPIVAHMVYNALVQLQPVQYIQIKKEA
jgi:membrane protease YdiL (CAAX protease family)